MTAKYILGAFAVVFLVAGAVRLVSGRRSAQARTWLLVGAIFAAASLWLFTRA
jgi:hypothetical protein